MLRNTAYHLSAVLSVIFLCTFYVPLGIANPLLLEEIVITAQKREQNLNDVGISVTALSGKQIRSLGFTNTIDISAQTPNLTYQQFHPTLTNVSLRGVSQNDFQDIHEPPVASYVDGVYISSMGAVHSQMFDLERVEVLRGPQGTLFGRNATGGLLHYITNKPKEEFGASVTLELAEYDQIKFEGAVGGALTDSILGRLSVATNRHDGWMENRIGVDLNNIDSRSIRGQLLFRLSEQANLLLKASHSNDDSNGYGYTHAPSQFGADGLGRFIGRNEDGNFADFGGLTFQTCTGCDAFFYREPDNDPRKGSFDESGKFDREINGITGTLHWEFNNFDFTSTTDFFSMKKDFIGDTDGSPVSAVVFHPTQDLDQWSQELRIQGENDNLNWTGGVYYLNIDNDVSHGVDIFNIAPFIGLNFPGSFVPLSAHYEAGVDSESYAVFGHIEYQLTNQLTLIAALRYTEDEREVDYTQITDGVPTLVFNDSTSSLADQDWENVSTKLQLDWRPNDNTLLYISYNRGHKAGNFSLPFIITGPPNIASFPHDEEILTSYELGYKGTFWDGRAQLNASFFYYDYKDYQTAFFVDFAQIVGNRDAEVVGGEVELIVSPVPELELVFGMSLLDTEVRDVGMPDGTVKDRELPQSADYSFNGIIRYTWPLRSGSVTAQYDFNYVNDTCFTVVCNPSEEINSYSISNARLAYSSAGDRWSVAAFIRNLTDEEYLVFSLDSTFAGFTTTMLNPPRWYGVSISYNW